MLPCCLPAVTKVQISTCHGRAAIVEASNHASGEGPRVVHGVSMRLTRLALMIYRPRRAAEPSASCAAGPTQTKTVRSRTSPVKLSAAKAAVSKVHGRLMLSVETCKTRKGPSHTEREVLQVTSSAIAAAKSAAAFRLYHGGNATLALLYRIVPDCLG